MIPQVLYAAHPPQFTVTLTLDQLAQRDARFGMLHLLRQRPSLPLIVQDSADLQQAHLRLCLGCQTVHGTPGALDEDGTGQRQPFHGWSELALEHALGLEVGASRTCLTSTADWYGEVQRWPQGVVYLFGPGADGPGPVFTRRLNLASFTDRLELEFLAQATFASWPVLRAHQLKGSGQPHILRAGCAAVGAATS